MRKLALGKLQEALGVRTGGERKLEQREMVTGFPHNPGRRRTMPESLRLATTLVSFVLLFVIGLQSCTVFLGGEVAQDENLRQGSAVGLLVAFFFLVGGAFATAFPLVSLSAFVLAALMAFFGSGTGFFGDMVVWGLFSLALAIMSFFGFLEKRRAGSSSS